MDSRRSAYRGSVDVGPTRANRATTRRRVRERAPRPSNRSASAPAPSDRPSRLEPGSAADAEVAPYAATREVGEQRAYDPYTQDTRKHLRGRDEPPEVA